MPVIGDSRVAVLTSPASSERRFAAAMAALGPFEPAPHLAVACSGGPDSLALALLARDWAAARGGQVTALCVDHGWRAESAEEAAATAAILRRLGMAAVVLGLVAVPTRRQEAAREARHAALASWCRGAGVLHLLFAHHRDDQAETLLLRLAAGSGPDGLAGMAALVETPYVRRLRPLLGFAKAELEVIVAAAGLSPKRDPGNRDPRFARPRLRASAAVLAQEGLSAARLAATASQLGQLRSHLDGETAAALVRIVVTIIPDTDAHGAEVHLDREGLLGLPVPVQRRCLQRAVACVGGKPYPAGLAVLDRLMLRLPAARTGQALSGGGCVIALRRGAPILLVLRRDLRSGAAAAGTYPLAPPAFVPACIASEQV